MWLTPLHKRILANTSTSPASSPTLEQWLYFLTAVCQPSLPLWSQPSLKSGALFLGQLGLGHLPPFPYIPRRRGQQLQSSCKAFMSLALTLLLGLGVFGNIPLLHCIVIMCLWISSSLHKVPFITRYFLAPLSRGPGQRVPDPLSSLSWEEPLSPN